jgi:transformation/transcription domain-associated protein
VSSAETPSQSAVLQPQNQQPANTPTRQSTATPSTASTPQGKAGPAQGQGQAQASSSTQTILPHALFSPKVLTECPIAVVLIFQSFKTLMHTAMQDFYPLVMDVSEDWHCSGRARGLMCLV